MNILTKIAAAALTLGLAVATTAPAAIAGPGKAPGGYNVPIPSNPFGNGLSPKMPGGNGYLPGKFKSPSPGPKFPPLAGGPGFKLPPGSGGPGPGPGKGKGWGKGYGYAAAGLAGAAIIGTAIAASRGGYEEGECYHVRQRVWDDEIGAYVKIRRLVCD
jgi:hypothetical protein